MFSTAGFRHISQRWDGVYAYQDQFRNFFDNNFDEKKMGSDFDENCFGFVSDDFEGFFLH